MRLTRWRSTELFTTTLGTTTEAFVSVGEWAMRTVMNGLVYVDHFLRTEKSALFSRFFLGNIHNMATQQAFCDLFASAAIKHHAQ